MLVKLLPEQISEFWEVLGDSIEQALPPITGNGVDRMEQLLSSLLSGILQCWASFTTIDGQVNLNGVVVTGIVHEQFSLTRDLLIYAVYGFGSATRKDWQEGYAALQKWAAASGCERLIGYTDVPGIIEFVKRSGGEARQTFITLPVSQPTDKNYS